MTSYAVLKDGYDHNTGFATLEEAIDWLADETGVSAEALTEVMRKREIFADDTGAEWQIESREDQPEPEGAEVATVTMPMASMVPVMFAIKKHIVTCKKLMYGNKVGSWAYRSVELEVERLEAAYAVLKAAVPEANLPQDM